MRDWIGKVSIFYGEGDQPDQEIEYGMVSSVGESPNMRLRIAQSDGDGSYPFDADIVTEARLLDTRPAKGKQAAVVTFTGTSRYSIEEMRLAPDEATCRVEVRLA